MEHYRLQLKTSIDEQTDRYKSILGIPRRKSKTLLQDIEHILFLVKNYKNISPSKLNLLIAQEFNIAQNTVVYVRPTLERANLLMKINGLVKLTNSAQIYFQEKNTAYLAKGFLDSYFGFMELLLLIAQNQPCKRNDIFTSWVNYYEEEFGGRALSTQKTQFHTIYRYLVTFNLINIDKSYLSLNEQMLNNLNRMVVY
ncbi:hypothetical protein [Mesobacillus foraminis]|uniref:Uncharacterized protein n=1 Tax=Mesobacillus foraminis TaxID=279826 RepID=A0A4R2B0L5_9BACI|nr:hypothetical protein [Mesobacillus foraminis]TCN18952.1 hypothetical protein EV146_11839 [Mesobacillus foraminis]